MMDLQKFSNDRTIAIAGAGLVGGVWAVVCARAGFKVRMFDANPEITRKAIPLIGVHAGAVDLATGADRAPGGVADYAARLGPLYQSIAASTWAMPSWSLAGLGEMNNA